MELLSLRRQSQTEETHSLLFVQFRNPNRVRPKYFFDYPERIVTLFDVDYFRRPAESLTHPHEIIVGCDDGIAVYLSLFPNDLVVASLQADITNVRQIPE